MKAEEYIQSQRRRRRTFITIVMVLLAGMLALLLLKACNDKGEGPEDSGEAQQAEEGQQETGAPQKPMLQEQAGGEESAEAENANSIELPDSLGEIVPTGDTRDEFSRIRQDFKDRFDDVQAKSGDIQISLLWDNYNDLDLSCVDPLGVEISFENRKSQSRGEMDVDMNSTPQSKRPVENIHWPRNLAPRGTYGVYVNFYRRHQKKEEATDYILRVSMQGQERQFKGSIRFGEPRQQAYQFDFQP